MDDWLNLRGDSAGKQKSLRGPLLLLAILVLIVVAFFLIYKAGQAKLRTVKPTGQVQIETVNG
jgi:cell division septal protein FtsQ